jgi:hypothetical protein
VATSVAAAEADTREVGQMTRASYRMGVAWIAENDEPSDRDPENVDGYISTLPRQAQGRGQRVRLRAGGGGTMSTTLAEPLGKTDIAALRKADDVYAVLYEGEHKLRCIKRVTFAERERDPFADDRRVDIAVNGWIRSWEKNDGNMAEVGADDDYQGFVSLWHSDGIWEIVRPGDRIQLEWLRGNYNEFLREHAPNVAVDYVIVYVVRTLPSGKTKRLRFQGACQAGAKNSARLIRSRAEGWI